MADNALDRKILAWLAECQRNGFLAMPIPADVESVLAGSDQPWTRGLCCADLPLEYEPRSLAVSPDGVQIAVGTKAGTVHLATSVDGKWTTSPLDLAKHGERGAAPARTNAVRGLAFLGNGLLLAGRSRGLFTLIDLAAKRVVDHYETGGRHDDDEPRRPVEDDWLVRFSGILPLFPGAAVPSADGAAIAIGLTPGGTLHLLCRTASGFSGQQIEPQKLLGGDSHVWLVDGHWWNEELWLLDSLGRLHCHRQDAEQPLGVGPVRGPFTVPYLRLHPDPRSLSPCRSGIALRFGDDVTFLPYSLIGNEVERAPIWVQVTGAIRCLAVQEFETKAAVYIAVTTSEAGLRWIPWRIGADSPSGPKSPYAQPLVFEGVVGSILEMALMHTAGVPLLVQATRNHRLRIVSLLDKQAIDKYMQGEGNRGQITAFTLSELIDRFLAPDTPRDKIEQFVLEAPAGVALRLLQRLVQRDFESLREVPANGNPLALGQFQTGLDRLGDIGVALLDRLDQADLYKALRQVKLSRWKLHDAPGDPDGYRAAVYRRYCLRIFQRASRIPPQTKAESALQGLARMVFDDIEKELRRELSRLDWLPLSTFAGSLRKWFIFGYTYGEKRQQLLELADWNVRCRRNADALYYLTHLMRARVDLRWERRVTPTDVSAAVWDLAAPSGAELLVHCHTDGRILATLADGRPLTWGIDGAGDEAQTVSKALRQGQISIEEDGHALCHALAREYRQIYRFGPYARCVQIDPIGDGPADRRFLIVFGMRAWNSTDLGPDEESARLGWPRHARLVALEVRWLAAAKRLDICQAAIRITSETFAIARVGPRATDDAKYVLAVGTSGLWMEPGAGDAQRPARRPFVEVEVLRGETAVAFNMAPRPDRTYFASSKLALAVTLPVIEEDPRLQAFEGPAAPPPRFGQGSNPSWSAASLRVDEPEQQLHQIWLWIGTNDGRVRSFLWQPEADAQPACWLEGGHRRQGNQSPPEHDPILTFAPVRKLRCLEPPKRTPGGILPLLAYGTADGVVGVVPLDRLFIREPPGSGDVHMPGSPGEAARAPGSPWVHLVHHRQRAGIRGLADYVDEGQWNLMAVTDEGRVILHRLGAAGTGNPVGGPPAASQEFLYRGMRLDQFPLDEPVRALVMTSRGESACWSHLRNEVHDDAAGGTSSAQIPLFIVAGRDGKMACYELITPKYSRRRREIVTSLVQRIFERERGQLADGRGAGLLARSVGYDLHPWLRLVDVGKPNLMRFSLWYELHQAHADLPADDSDGPHEVPYDLGERVDRYCTQLEVLTREVYGRRPINQFGARILWSETAHFARKIARLWLAAADLRERDTLLAAYDKLLRQIDHLCNRWIGADQALEAMVLVHSFNELFSPASLMLIAADRPGPSENLLDDTRALLLFRLVQRRFRHGDILVPFEAIRTMNDAMLRALAENLPSSRWTFRHRGSRSKYGFHDLLTLVGDVARQQVRRLTPSDPLYTELAKFFALSILLVPDGTLSVGQVVSESGLAEHGADLSRHILIQALMLRQQLARGSSGINQGRVDAPIRKFQAYLSREVDLECETFATAGGKAENQHHPWRQLLSEKDFDAKAKDVFSDRQYLAEQREVYFTVARLARLTGRPGDLPWLQEEEQPVHFRESKAYLRHLASRREQLEAIIAQGDDGRTTSPRKLCEEEAARLDTWPLLVEPHKSHYRAIIDAWRRELDLRAIKEVNEARLLVELIERFNRHVYRISADDLMASLIDLALRVAPLGFDESGAATTDRPLRMRIGERIEPFPALADLFQRGTLLVHRSHLAATLLHLAESHLRPVGRTDSGRSSWLFDLHRLWKAGEVIAAVEGVAWGPSPPILQDSRAIPGDDYIWRTILQELARNIRAYCPDRPGRPSMLQIAWDEIPIGRGTCGLLRIGGSLAFYDTLSGELVDEVDGSAEKLLEKVAAIGSAPRVRYAPERRDSYGFGLYFLTQLANLLDIKAQFVLVDPNEYLAAPLFDAGRLRQPEASSFTTLKEKPLTMAFWWPMREGD
jgi:hypothetical protein